ncbi:MAG: hypothetical protein ABL878_08950 [Burkholderiales bacterium]
MTYLAFLFGVCALLALWRFNVRELARVHGERARMFDSCLSLFDRVQTVADRSGFPTLSGRYRGHEIKLRTIVDAVGFRKFPSLWLQADLQSPTGIDGVLDLLVRPQNIEFYSPSADLPEILPLPSAWPAFATLRANNRTVLPVLAVLTPHVVRLFAHPQAKELLITPLGVRIVYQLTQSVAAHYLVLRAAKFESLDVAQDLLTPLLEQALSIHAALSGTEPCTGNNIARAA